MVFLKDSVKLIDYRPIFKLKQIGRMLDVYNVTTPLKKHYVTVKRRNLVGWTRVSCHVEIHLHLGEGRNFYSRVCCAVQTMLYDVNTQLITAVSN